MHQQKGFPQKARPPQVSQAGDQSYGGSLAPQHRQTHQIIRRYKNAHPF